MEGRRGKERGCEGGRMREVSEGVRVEGGRKKRTEGERERGGNEGGRE